MLFRRYILLFLTLLSLSLQGQQYPVDIQVFATPPYPQSLRGYADTFEEKLQAHFLLKDLSTGGRPFVLRLSLENFQGQVIAQTPDYIAPYLLNLTPGVRRTLSNIDFKSLLKYENLYGINESTYNGLLPEGTYFLCLSLYDSATGRPVSNKGRAMLQVRRYAPPIPTMPQKGEVLTKKNAFQHIVFQWMPRDIAPFMQYEFTLKEVWDLSLVPEEAFMTGRQVYQTQTYAPALAYTNMMPILLENKRYVWQVRAFTNNPNNPNEPSYFKNNGNSETFYFDLVSHCEAPKFLTAISESTSAQLRWSAQAMMPNQEYPYKVMYRERGKSWKSQKVSMPNAKLTGLKRGRTYIYKVGVACGLNATHSSSVFGQESYMYSTEQEFTTTEQIDQKSQVQCGVKPQVHIKNTSPLQDNLYPNTTFTAGDFPVTVLNATGSNGVYSGEGYVKVPYLQDTKIKVSFNNIKLNTERQLIDGKLITTYDQTERNVQFVQEGIGEVFGDKGKKDQKMPFEIENQNNIQVDSISGRITITGKVDPKTGIAPKVTLPKGRDYVITDSKGKVYQLDENGKVTAQGTREEGTQLAQQAGKGDSKNPPIDNKHFKVEWLFNDELATDLTGDIPYKVLVKGKTSSFELRIQPANTTKYDFFFHTENGVKIEAESKGDGLYKITRKGAFDFAQEELWVVAKEKKDKKEELIGKCVLVHLSPKEVNVALVPTQSGQNLQEAIAQVQQIYEKVGVTLHITTEKPFDINDQLKNGTLPTENEFGDLSTYSPEQNAVIAKFATNRKPKENTYYIFLVNDGTGDHGYMRLGGQYGFVYSTNARTIAHELGHGIFKLEHPFKGKNADKGKTTALMDYNNGQDFFYRDWKQINDPKVKLYAFQGQKEGKLVGEEDPVLEKLKKVLQELDGNAFLKCKICEKEKETSSDLSKNYRIGVEGNIYEFSLPINGVEGNGTDSKDILYKKYKCYLTTIEALVGSSERLSVIKNGKTEDKKVETFLNEFKKALSQSPKEFLFVRSDLLQTICNVPLFFPEDFCTTSTISDSLRKYTLKELEACMDIKKRDLYQTLSDKKLLLIENLKYIRSQLREGQLVDWEENGKVYTLSPEGFLIEKISPLSAEAIRKGDWRGVETQYARFYRTDKGYIQLMAFGFRKDLPVLKGKKADLVALSEHIQQQTNTFFKPLKEVTDKPQLSPDPDTFADGRRFVISEQASYLRLFSEGTGIVTTLLKTGEVEENVYLEQPTGKAYIQAPGVITGSTEVIAQKVTDITSLATTVYGIVVDAQVRRELKEQFIALKEQIGDDPQVLYSIFKEIVLTALTGNTSEEWASVTNTDTDTGKRSHLATRAAGNVIISAMVGTQLVKELPKMGKKFAQKTKEVEELAKELIKELTKKVSNFPQEIKAILEDSSRFDRYTLTKITQILTSTDSEILEKLLNAQGFDKVLADMAQYWTKFQGGEFQIAYAKRLIAEGKIISFEVSNLSDDLHRIYDIKVEYFIKGELKTKLLELKNWNRFYPETIKNQFLKDLQKMEDLGEIQWIFAKTDNISDLRTLKAKVIAALKTANGEPIKELKKLFKPNSAFSEKFLKWTKGDKFSAELFLEWLDKPEIFEKIFEIVD